MARPLKKFVRAVGNAVLAAGNRCFYPVKKMCGSGDVVNKVEIRFAGLQRSGNHAFINWIFNQTSGRKCLLNWVMSETNPFFSFHKKSTARELQKNFYKDFNIPMEKMGFFSKKDLLIYTYEDDFLEKVGSNNFEACHGRWVGRSGKRFDLIIVRDPFNLTASRLKRDDDKIENRYSCRIESERNTYISLWRQYAKEYLGITNYLKHNKICVNYNRWFAEKPYREEIAGRLGLEFTDKGMEEVVHVGGGSSFDNTGYDSKASEMKVLDRWRNYADDKDFKLLLGDCEILELSKKIFGEIPGIGS